MVKRFCPWFSSRTGRVVFYGSGVMYLSVVTLFIQSHGWWWLPIITGLLSVFGIIGLAIYLTMPEIEARQNARHIAVKLYVLGTMALAASLLRGW